MNKYRVVSEWTVAPANQGQIVERATAYAEGPGGMVVRITRTVDRSDGQVCYYGPRGGKIPVGSVIESEED
ncbi:MAG TPA: hypothetical protein VJ553_02220 [Candidatus Paceibacterota bacterium]|nr:MAG: hypothetical protein A2Z31_01200 [candidate division NC10 bacterium RBG_16_65_8]HXK36371.1 hypothetical protein [Candidatus Paceibacterota bacterium]